MDDNDENQLDKMQSIPFMEDLNVNHIYSNNSILVGKKSEPDIEERCQTTLISSGEIRAIHQKGETMEKIFVKKTKSNLRKPQLFERWIENPTTTINQCFQCQKIFKTKFSLNRHIMNVHNQINPYKCNDCDESISHPDHLKIHMKQHHRRNNEKSRVVETAKSVSRRPKKYKNNKCSVCKNIFKSEYALNRHMRLHTKDNHYHCTLCEESFPRPDYLKRHIKRHKRELDRNRRMLQLSVSETNNESQTVEKEIKPVNSSSLIDEISDESDMSDVEENRETSITSQVLDVADNPENPDKANEDQVVEVNGYSRNKYDDYEEDAEDVEENRATDVDDEGYADDDVIIMYNPSQTITCNGSQYQLVAKQINLQQCKEFFKKCC